MCAMRPRIEVFFVWLIVCLCPECSKLAANEVLDAKDSPAELAAKTLAWELESRRSIDLQVRAEVVTVPPVGGDRPQSTTDIYVERYVETATGQRFTDHRGLQGDQIVARWESYCDGSRSAQVDYRRGEPDVQNTVSLMRQYWREDENERKNLPAPLIYNYVGREPLHKALPKAIPLGPSTVINHLCEDFLFRAVRWNIPQDQVFTLDRDTGTPLKVAAYRDEAERVSDKPLWIWTAENLEFPSGHPVVRKSILIAYDQEKKPVATWNFMVEHVIYNKDFPESFFWPAIQPGADVFDSFTGKATPGKRANRQNLIAQSASQNLTTETFEAVPPAGWGGHLRLASLTFGGFALIAAGVLLRRHR